MKQKIFSAPITVCESGRRLLAEILRQKGVIAEGHLSPNENPVAEPDIHSLVFYSQFLSSGDLCFDIGANVGNRTRIFQRLGARVISVEPLASVCEELRNRFGTDSGVTVLNKAVGRSSGKGILYANSYSPVSSMNDSWTKELGWTDDTTTVHAEMVDIVTLDSLVAEYGEPSFVKIDTEGYELEVLAGLSKPLQTISFEFHPILIDKAKQCMQYLSQLEKFTFNISANESFTFALDHWIESDKMQHTLDD